MTGRPSNFFPKRPPTPDRLYHVALETDDAVAMRDYLAANGVKVPDKVGKGRIGNLNYFIKDPDGHIVEIVQYAPDSLDGSEPGKIPPRHTHFHKHRAHGKSWLATSTLPKSSTRAFLVSTKSGAARKIPMS